MDLLIVDGVDITHFRLMDLTQLADQAKPFYDWVEAEFRNGVASPLSLDMILKTASQDEIQRVITACYQASGQPDLPLLFDGIGRSYSHAKACYYFFSWPIRDAPQQRLGPLVQRIIKNTGKDRTEVEVTILASLIYKYRPYVKTFIWEAVREVIIDRLEGSRRSLKGHEKETIVRTALLIAVQNYFSQHQNYGTYSAVEIPEGQVKIGNECYDASANLLDAEGRRIRRILIPIKTRETEGGGHSHLFSRDISSAILAARYDSPEDYLAVIIVARNWSLREADLLDEKVDHLAVFNLDPGEFSQFSSAEQERLNLFVGQVLSGSLPSKTSTGQ